MTHIMVEMSFLKRLTELCLSVSKDQQILEINSLLHSYVNAQNVEQMIHNLIFLTYVHSYWCSCDVNSLQEVIKVYTSKQEFCNTLSGRINHICRAFGAVIMFFFENTCLKEQAYAAIALHHRVLLDLPKEKYQPWRAQSIVKAMNDLHSSDIVYDMKQYRKLVTESRTARKCLKYLECPTLYFFTLMSPESMRLKFNELHDIKKSAIQCHTWTDFVCLPKDHRVIVCDRDLFRENPLGLCPKNDTYWNIMSDHIIWRDDFIHGYSRYILSVLIRYGTNAKICEVLDMERTYASQVVGLAAHITDS